MPLPPLATKPSLLEYKFKTCQALCPGISSLSGQLNAIPSHGSRSPGDSPSFRGHSGEAVVDKSGTVPFAAARSPRRRNPRQLCIKPYTPIIGRSEPGLKQQGKRRHAHSEGGAQPLSRDAVGRTAAWTLPDRHWFALYTKARQEKSLAREMLKQRIPVLFAAGQEDQRFARPQASLAVPPICWVCVPLWGGRGTRAMPGHQPDFPSPRRRAAGAACFRSAAVSPTDRRQRPADDRSPPGAGAKGEGAPRGICRAGGDRA